jgi:hypothetical protein
MNNRITNADRVKRIGKDGHYKNLGTGAGRRSAKANRKRLRQAGKADIRGAF